MEKKNRHKHDHLKLGKNYCLRSYLGKLLGLLQIYDRI